MRTLHRVRTGGTHRTPTISSVLYVGSNTFGKLGGISGNPVNGVEVAHGKAAEVLRNARLLTDEQLLQLAELHGSLDMKILKRLEKEGVSLIGANNETI